MFYLKFNTGSLGPSNTTIYQIHAKSYLKCIFALRKSDKKRLLDSVNLKFGQK